MQPLSEHWRWDPVTEQWIACTAQECGGYSFSRTIT
jgi:hypothetical protein